MELYIQYRRYSGEEHASTMYFTYPPDVDHALTYDRERGYLHSTYTSQGVMEQHDIVDFQNISEEELFQLMCVWDSAITIDQMIALQKHLKYCIRTNKDNHDDRIEVP